MPRKHAAGAEAGAPPVQRLLVNATTTAEMLSISARSLWQLTHDGAIPSVRLGRRRLYDVRDLTAFIDRVKAAGSPAAPQSELPATGAATRRARSVT